MASRPASTSGSARLRKLKVVKEAAENVHIILVPGVGTIPCDSWAINAAPWTDFLASQGPGVIIHAYDHGIPLDEHFRWDHLLEEGQRFLADLKSFHDSHKGLSSPQPLLFICHSLGGSITKQALCIAGLHYDRYSELLNSIAGIVFLGTPHRLEGVSDAQFGDRVISILKLEGGPALNRQFFTLLKEQAHFLFDLAVRFNRTNLRVHVLSVYENKVTRIRDTNPLRTRARKIIIVDESLCSIDTTTEQKLQADLDHLELPSMSEADGRPIDQIRIWLEFVISKSPANVKSQLLRDKARHGSSPDSSTTSSSLPFEEVREALTRQVRADETTKGPAGPRRSNATSTYVNVGSGTPEIQALLENFSFQQVDPRIPCFMVDTFVKNKDFFGRENLLKELDDCLLPSKTLLVSSQPDRIRVGLLCGLGGLGKTEMAVEYVYSRRDMFDAVFWVSAEDTTKLEANIATIAVRLGIHDPNAPNDKAINKSLAIEWLCNPYKIETNLESPGRVSASWLLVFDNADEPDILTPYSDIAKSGAVLITSRSPLAQTSFSPFTKNLGIREFDEEEAGRFMQKLTGREDHVEEAREIGKKLGGLPLALAQMAGFIRLEFLTYAEFVKLYDDVEEEADIHETELQPLRKTARGNLSTVWALDKLSDHARAILELASFLDSDCIQEYLLWGEAVKAANLPIYPTRWRLFLEARKQLIGSSLFRHNGEKGECWMHRVTRDVVRAKMEPKDRYQMFTKVVSIITAAWPAAAVGGHDVSLWEKSEAMHRHVMSLRDVYLKYFAQGNFEGRIELATLLCRAAWYQHERGESYQSDIRYTLEAVSNETNDAAGCTEHAAKFLEIRLAVAAETGIVDERLARAHNEMGIAWMMTGHYEKGQESFATAAKEYEKVPNYTKDKRSLALVNLGLAYWLQNKLDEAEAVLRLGLADREELYGVMDTHSFRTGRFLHALGNVCFSQGRVDESEEFHRKALKQYQSTIRNRHHRTADVCHKLAQHCLRKGQLDEGLRFIEQALKVWSVDHEKYAPEISRTSYLKAKALFSAGREEEATRVFQKAVQIRRKLRSDVRKDDIDLQEEDFDELVTFWSR